MPDSYCYYLVYGAFLFIFFPFVGLHLYPTLTFLGFKDFVVVHFCIQFI